MYQVYKYIFPNGKLYIGVTAQTIQHRRDCGYQHNKLLQAAHRYYGWENVRTEILAQTESECEAYRVEMEMIAKYQSNDPNFGYNVSAGGKATFKGLNHTAAHRKHMSELYTGRSFSAETMERMKASHAKERRAVIRIDEDGVREIFESLRDAAAAVNGHGSNITRACNNHKKYHGYSWEFVIKGVN